MKITLEVPAAIWEAYCANHIDEADARADFVYKVKTFVRDQAIAGANSVFQKEASKDSLDKDKLAAAVLVVRGAEKAEVTIFTEK